VDAQEDARFYAGQPAGRRIALVTGVGRRAGIGAAVTHRLASDGLDVAFAGWTPYDERMPWGADTGTAATLTASVEPLGVRTVAFEADFEDAESPARLFDDVERLLGPVAVLVLCHCESVESGILGTTLESLDRHFAVNARASWLLIREYASRFRSGPGTGRVIALTSDHTAGNLPYGASKAALERITLAAANEFGRLGITANAVDPGPTDTGWMTPSVMAAAERASPLGRVGQAADVANLVSFLCSEAGAWVNGQVLRSDGGIGTR
jgi:3-oxoacyl-[acyl-carrier protein] reductase